MGQPKNYVVSPQKFFKPLLLGWLEAKMVVFIYTYAVKHGCWRIFKDPRITYLKIIHKRPSLMTMTMTKTMIMPMILNLAMIMALTMARLHP